ncbi:hypothetical protein DB345_07220 [Spartobacteria bacterium LR76]|nr:hypothetical protein DB345_07220 [Spartobacteria bacterium LR76]
MPSDFTKDPDPYLELQESPEDLGDEVQKTNTELEKLKRQLEDIEKQKQRLEELKRRQDELENGRIDMADKLTRSLVTVQREIEESQKRLEQLNQIFNSFTQHLRYIEGINAKAWGTNELPKELSKALSAVEDARADYAKALPKIAPDVPVEAAPAATGYEAEYGYAEERGFIYWLKSGVAFTLPLWVLGIAGLLVWIWSISAGTH